MQVGQEFPLDIGEVAIPGPLRQLSCNVTRKSQVIAGTLSPNGMPKPESTEGVALQQRDGR